MIKYVWLNIQTSEFSNSWNEKDHQILKPDENGLPSDYKISHEWKLIKYECLNDDNFNFSNLMKLR
jgi:hypothetical protein